MPVHLSPYAIDVALYFCGTRAKQTGKNMKKGGVVVVPTEIVCAQHWAFRHISNCVGVGPSLPYSSWKACHKYWCVLSMGEWPSTEPKHLYNDISIGVDQLWWGGGGGKGGGGALLCLLLHHTVEFPSLCSYMQWNVLQLNWNICN